MTEGNGRILTPHRPFGKKGDYITRAECNAMIVEECTKVHEHYLTQIPAFTAKMIQDALLSYGLINLQAGELATSGAAAGDSTGGQEEQTSEARDGAVPPQPQDSVAAEAALSATNAPLNGQERPGSTPPLDVA